MINLNEAEVQKSGTFGPIPKNSIVKVRLEIRKPKKADKKDPAVTVFSSKIKGLDCELTVTSGQFEGVKIWENIFLPPNMQTIQLSKGQTGICNRGFSMCRAIVEASRNIDPNDETANRSINSWFDLHGLEFPIKVGIITPKPGDKFINNSIVKIITPEIDNYQVVMGGGEIITEEPIPEIPEAKVTDQDKAAWADSPATPAPATPTQVGKTDNVPDWAK
jgi:hypothetical protein